MGYLVLLEVVVEGYEVETQFLGDDIYRGTTGQRRIHVHHAGIEAVAGVGCHIVFGFQTVIALIPMAECHQIAVLQLAPLRYACGT